MVVSTCTVVRFRSLNGPRCLIPFWSRGNHEEPGITTKVQSGRFFVQNGPF